MPDITMCMNDTCPMRWECGRHQASGTQPTPMPIGQSYAMFTPKNNKECPNKMGIRK